MLCSIFLCSNRRVSCRVFSSSCLRRSSSRRACNQERIDSSAWRQSVGGAGNGPSGWTVADAMTGWTCTCIDGDGDGKVIAAGRGNARCGVDMERRDAPGGSARRRGVNASHNVAVVEATATTTTTTTTTLAMAEKVVVMIRTILGPMLEGGGGVVDGRRVEGASWTSVVARVGSLREHVDHHECFGKASGNTHEPAHGSTSVPAEKGARGVPSGVSDDTSMRRKPGRREPPPAKGGGKHQGSESFPPQTIGATSPVDLGPV